MSWLKKARSYRVLIAFMSGFAAASLMWFFVSHSSRNLPVERGAVLMPGALGRLLTPPTQSTTAGYGIRSEITGNTGKTADCGGC